MSEQLLQNPSFEGITQPGEWTRNTHIGVEFGEMCVPAGWVAWWEEVDEGNKCCNGGALWVR